jgi:hypothetical protein
MKAYKIVEGNPHYYIYIADNFAVKASKQRTTRINSRQVVVWVGGRPLVFEL